MPSNQPETAYHLDPELLYNAVNLRRLHLELTWKEIATTLGVSANTFTRLQQGVVPTTNAALSIMLWAGLQPDEVCRRRRTAPIPAQRTHPSGLHPDDQCRKD